ncbi:hypothetical protein AAG906_025532 [Vitis piasezkii]
MMLTTSSTIPLPLRLRSTFHQLKWSGIGSAVIFRIYTIKTKERLEFGNQHFTNYRKLNNGWRHHLQYHWKYIFGAATSAIPALSGTTCSTIGSAFWGCNQCHFRAATSAIPTSFQVSFHAGKRRCSQRLEVTSEALLAGDASSRKARVRLFMPLMHAAPWLAGDEAVHRVAVN